MIGTKISTWIGNFAPRSVQEALAAFDEARRGYAPADPRDILHEVALLGGSRLMEVRNAGGETSSVVVVL